MSSSINWNNTIDYIKMQLGADVNQLEIDEYKLLDIIQTVTMPEFCQYYNYIDRISYPSEQLTAINSEYKPRYKITNYDRQVYEIKEIYFPSNTLISHTVFNSADAVAAATGGYTYGMTESLMPVRSWQFFRPDIIELTIPIGYSEPSHFVIEVGAEFKNPNEMEPSMYSAFKKLAAADVIDYVISLRSKFEQLTTPQGTINLNINRLEQKSMNLRNSAMQKLENTQPDVLWSWVNI